MTLSIKNAESQLHPAAEIGDTKNSLSLHPAADVFRSQLLAEVSEENEKMAEEIEHLQRMKQFLGTITMEFSSGASTSVSLDKAFVIDDFASMPTLCVRIDDPSAYALSEFRSGKVLMGGQIIGSLPGQQRLALVSRDSGTKLCKLKLITAMSVVVEGSLRLHKSDFRLCKDQEFGEELLSRYLKSGKGLRTPQSVTFTPQIVYMAIGGTLRETIRVLGITAKMSNVGRRQLPTLASIEKCRPLPENPRDCIECPPPSPSDNARRMVVEAIGSADQLKLLEKNLELKDLHFRLSTVEERIDSVELLTLTHRPDDTKLPPSSLSGGKLVKNADGSLVWQIGFLPPVTSLDIDALDIVISGVSSGVKKVVAPHGRSGLFETTFELSGTKVVGCSHGSIEFNLLCTIMGLNPASLSSDLSMLSYADIPLESVRKTLDVLGVDYSHNGSEEED